MVSDCKFAENIAGGGAADATGGAVYTETFCEHCTATVSISRSEFHRNTAKLGGALAAGKGTIDLSIEDCNFYENGIRGTLADLAKISEVDLASMVSQMALNSRSETRFIAAFRELYALNPIRWADTPLSEWCSELGVSAKETLIKSFIPSATVEGGALYFEGRSCEAADRTTCHGTVLDGADDAANLAICEATNTSPQAASNGNHVTCAYTAAITEFAESCLAIDGVACAEADMTHAQLFVRRANCIGAGRAARPSVVQPDGTTLVTPDCEYTYADPANGVVQACVATAKAVCEGADMGDARPATGNPLTGDELSCIRSCSTTCDESCSDVCTPVSVTDCAAASDPGGTGPCVYTLPVVGVIQECKATHTGLCGTVDVSGDWRSSERDCQAAGQCVFLSGETDVRIERCAFDANIAKYGRHLQAYSAGQMMIRESYIPDYDESSVDIVSATVAEPGCRAHPCSPGQGCRDEKQSTYCARCPDGMMSADGVECVPCPPGLGPNVAQDTCVKCEFGLHSSGWGEVCRPCLPGFQPRNRTDDFTFVAGKCLTFQGLIAELNGSPRTEADCTGDRRTWVPSACTSTSAPQTRSWSTAAYQTGRAYQAAFSHGVLVATGETEEECLAYPTSCEGCDWGSLNHSRRDPFDTDMFDLDSPKGFHPILVDGALATDTFYWSEGRQCRRCNPGHEPTTDRSSCRLCVDTFSSDGRQCLQCPAGSQPETFTGAAVCVTCLSVAPLLMSGNGSMCETCAAGMQPNPENQTYCEDCPVGRASLTGATCDPCGPGNQPNPGLYACEPCSSFGLNLHSITGEPCTKCPPGEGPSRDFDACEQCETGKASVDGECVVCGKDYHAALETCTDTIEGEVVVDCATGYTAGDDTIPSTSCPTGCTQVDALAASCSGTAADATVACSGLTVAPVIESCTLTLGTAPQETTAATTCTLTSVDDAATPAVVGSCAVAMGSGSCAYVPPVDATCSGEAGCTLNSATSETCDDIIEGEVVADCATGYTAGDDSTPSTSCPTGCTQVDAVLIIAARQPTASQMGCESCMIAEVVVGLPDEAPFNVAPVVDRLGMRAEILAGACGFLVSSGTPMYECRGHCVPITTSCDTWFWSEGSECRRCDPGNEPGPDRSICQPCASTHSPDGGQCLQCQPGTQPIQSVGAATCQNCTHYGASMASLDGNKCLTCPAGYQPTVDRDDCMECPPGRASLTGAECDVCQPGFAPGVTRSTCDPCLAGRFSTDGITCRLYTECENFFNDSAIVPALLENRGSSCLNANGVSKEVDDIIECERVATGYRWISGLPSECLAPDNVTIMYNLLEPACERVQTNYVWDYDWEYCREPVTNVWRNTEPSSCLQIDNVTLVYTVLQPDCEQSLDDWVWTEELCSLLPSICTNYVQTSEVRNLCIAYNNANRPSYAPECSWDNMTTGRVWAAAVPAACYTAEGILVPTATTQSRCYLTGARILGPTSPLHCLMTDTGRTWTAPVIGVCFGTVNNATFAATTRSDCEFQPTGYTWTDANPYFGGGADSCLPCPPGTELADDGSRCDKCSTGKFSTNGEDCDQCIAGSEPMYCENMPAVWQSAPSNTTTVGSLTCMDYQRLSLCTFDGGYGVGWDPTDGIFSDWSTDGIDATEACCVCGGGKPTPGPSVCLNCSSVGANMVSPLGNACVQCSAGFQPTTYQENCMECPPGRASLMGDECITCLPGTAPGASRSLCESCGAGRFSHDGVACRTFEQCGAIFNQTRDFPAEHPLGFIPVALAGSGQCFQCPDGTERSADGTACSACAEGRSSMGGDPCQPCSPGYISTPHKHNCRFCAEAGTEPNLPLGASFCKTCPVGQYSRGHGQYCTDCFANSHSFIDLSFCECNSGWRTAGVSVTNFTGGDLNDGLDLLGDFMFAVDVAGNGGVSAQNASFTAETVAGVTIVSQREQPIWGPPNVFGDSPADAAVVAITKGIVYSSTRDFSIDVHPNPVKILLEGLLPKTRYRLQLLFAEKLDQMGIGLDRGFDVIIDGYVVLDDFSPLESHGTTQLSRYVAGGGVGAVVTVDMLSNGDTALVELGGATAFPDGTNPFIQAFTLERGELNDDTNVLHPTSGWVAAMDVMCTDTDECAVDNGGCDVLTACTNHFGARACALCPAGFNDAPSQDYSPTTGNTTCEPKAVTGSLQTAPLRQVSLDMEADAAELGDPPHTAYMERLAADLAASLGLNASEVQLTSLTVARRRLEVETRRRLQTMSVSFSFVILAEDESAALADLDAQLSDPSSPLLTVTTVLPGQDPFDGIGVGCPQGMVIDPIDEVCTNCALGQQVVDDICVDCGAGFVGDGFQCLFCEAGSEPSYRNRQRAGDPNDPTAFPAGTDCRLCAEIGPAYATDTYDRRLRYSASSFCFACPGGAQPNENRSDCIFCETLGPNVASNGAACLPCADGSMPSADRSRCVPCAPGESSNGTECVACPAGYEGGNGTYRECQICRVDSYSPQNASESCTQCPSKADTRGVEGEGAAAACKCSGNPDNPVGGSYNQSLFFADGEKYFDDDGDATGLYGDLLEFDPQPLIATNSLWGRPVEVLSCWDGGDYEDSSDVVRAGSHVCVVCPACFDCSAGTGSEPFTGEGYWREKPESPKAHKCLYKYGCVGGRDSRCNVSYTGALCASCDQGYTPNGGECQLCPLGFFSFLFAAGAAVIFFSMGIFIIGQNNLAMKTWTRDDVIKHGPKEPELITVAARTLYAFLTVQSLTGDFRLEWPTFIVQVNEIQAMIAQPTVLMTFLKCVRPPKEASDQVEEGEDVPWAFVRAIYMLILMPMFCILGPFAYFFALHLLSMVKKMGGGMSRENIHKSMKDMKASGGGDAKSLYGDKLFSSIVILLFILHPSLVRETLYLFPCQTLEDGLSVLRANPGIVCGTAMHWSWMVFVAIPSFVFWCAGLPGFAMYRLHAFSRTHSNGIVDLDAQFNEMVDLAFEEPSRLDDEDVMRRWGFLYRG